LGFKFYLFRLWIFSNNLFILILLNHSKDLILIWISKSSFDLFFKFLVLSPWFIFQIFEPNYKNFYFSKVPKSCFDLYLFCLIQKFECVKFKPFVFNTNSLNGKFKSYFYRPSSLFPNSAQPPTTGWHGPNQPNSSPRPNWPTSHWCFHQNPLLRYESELIEICHLPQLIGLH
jgi:hypothetical protein